VTASGKRRAAKTPAATRARSGGNGLTAAAARDIAESQRRANVAKTPVARAHTRRIVERKKQVYTDEAVRQAAAQVKQGSAPAGGAPARKTKRGAQPAGTTTRKSTRRR